MDVYGQNIRLCTSMYFLYLLKNQPQAASRRSVAHLQLDLTWDLLPIILRIVLGFAVKISIFFLEQRRISRSFCFAVAFCASERACYSVPAAFIHRFSLWCWTWIIKWYCVKVFLLAGEPSTLSVVTLYENQRLKVRSACSDVSSEE